MAQLDSYSFSNLKMGNTVFTSAAEMQAAAEKFPYSLPLQALMTKNLKQSNKLDYEKYVRLSSVLSPDRRWLFDFVHARTENPVAEPVAEISDSPEVKTTRVVENHTVESKAGPIAAATPVVVQPVIHIEVSEETPIINSTVADAVSANEELVVAALAHVPQIIAAPEIPVQVIEKEPVTIVEAMAPVVAEAPEITIPEEKPVTPTVVETPVAEPENEAVEPVKQVPESNLEREILKVAIDKSIQQEVGQYDFEAAEKHPATEEKEQQPSGFQYWLSPKTKAESREEKLRKIDQLIEKFIKSEPRIAPKKTEFYSPLNVARQSVAYNEELVSEPLAAIFEKQGYFDKAIKAYEKLSLKFPEKRTYFAARIEKIREIIKNIKNNK